MGEEAVFGDFMVSLNLWIWDVNDTIHLYQRLQKATGFPKCDTVDPIVFVKNTKDNLPPTYYS